MFYFVSSAVALAMGKKLSKSDEFTNVRISIEIVFIVLSVDTKKTTLMSIEIDQWNI